MPLWKAQIENTSVPGGPLALQVRPLLTPLTVTFNASTSRPEVMTWKTGVLAIREVEVNPSGSKNPGFISRPTVGRIIPPWAPTRNAELIQLGFTGYNRGDPVRQGTTPGGTVAGGPSFSEQISLPRTPGASHKIYHFRLQYPEESPLVIWGAGTHDYSTDGTILPAPAMVLYCGSSRSTSEQTLHGSIIFEEL